MAGLQAPEKKVSLLNSLIVEQHIRRKEVEAGDVCVATDVVVHAGQLSVESKVIFFTLFRAWKSDFHSIVTAT